MAAVRAASRRRSGIGAEQRLVAAGGRDGGIARAHDETGKAFIGHGLDFRPERGEMGAVVDDERGDAEFSRTLGEHGNAKLEGRVGEAALGIDLDDGEPLSSSGTASALTLPALTVRSAPSMR